MTTDAKPTDNGQVPEERVSSPAHQEWLKERKKQDPLNPMPISEKPTAPADVPGLREELAELLHHKLCAAAANLPYETCADCFESVDMEFLPVVQREIDAAVEAEHIRCLNVVEQRSSVESKVSWIMKQRRT